MEKTIEEIWREGRKIAHELGNGVQYEGPSMTLGDDEFELHCFTDKAVKGVRGTTFTGNTLAEAKTRLIELRQQWKKSPPKFKS